MDGDFQCPNCTTLKYDFEFARAALVRSEEAMKLVHSLKYGGSLYLAKELGMLACESLDDIRLREIIEEGWPLVPVPLHWRRRMQRQFNQAEELAKVIGKKTGLRVEKRLLRHRRTRTQTRLSRRKRLENLRGAFRIARPFQVPLGKKKNGFVEVPGVILIDDVFTTGSTVQECARVLRRSGVRRIVVVTAVRG